MTLFSASTLGAPDLFKLHNQTAAYWARKKIIRLVGMLGRVFFNIFYLGVQPRSSYRVDGISRARERRREEADEDKRPGVDSVHGEFKVMAARSERTAKNVLSVTNIVS